MGTSIGVLYDRWAVGDHPHAYGDKLLLDRVAITFKGSSPRVWGQDKTTYLSGATEGIIPTRMGTRKIYSNIAPVDKDHPHAYGDKFPRLSPRKFRRGSSPRVWGQVFFKSVKHHLTGIIPTRMGTSLAEASAVQVEEDHPHAYGDKKSITIIKKKVRGSSPRVWGQGLFIR